MFLRTLLLFLSFFCCWPTPKKRNCPHCAQLWHALLRQRLRTATRGHRALRREPRALRPWARAIDRRAKQNTINCTRASSILVFTTAFHSTRQVPQGSQSISLSRSSSFSFTIWSTASRTGSVGNVCIGGQ